MNDVIFVPAEQKAVVMVPLEAVKADLVTKQEHTIFVPLADDYNYGVVKVGAGLNFSAGVVSLNNDVVLALISKTPYVSYGEKQNLTEEQMRQARDNIRAGDSGFSGYYKDLIGKLEIATNEEAKEGVVVDKAINPFQLRDALKDVDLSTKLDKNTTVEGNRVYVSQSDSDGNIIQTTMPYAVGEQRNTLALRDSSGRIYGVCTANSGDATLTTKQYVDNRVDGSNKAISFENYETMISQINEKSATEYNIGQNVMIVTLNVPDLWISDILETSQPYTYTDDDSFVGELALTGSVQIGYYKLSALETQKVDLTNYATVAQVSSKVQKVQYSKDQTFADGSDAGAIGRLYMRFRDNTENSIVAHCQSYKFTVPVRDATGNFYVSDPTQPYHTANKRTVTAMEGAGAPTTSTTALYVGQFYHDTSNDKTYQCTAIDTTNKTYTWTQLIRSTDYAANSVKGVVDVRAAFGMQTDQWGRIQTVKATDEEVIAKTNEYHPLVAKNVDQIVKTGMTTNALEWSTEEKANARNLIGSAGTETASNTYSDMTGKYTGTAGLFMFDGGGKGGVFKSTAGGDGPDRFRIKKATFTDIANRAPSNYHDAGVGTANHCCPITPANMDYAIKRSLLDNKLNGYVYNGVDYSWTDSEKVVVRDFFNLVDTTNYQKITGVKVFETQLGIANTDGTIDYFKHINNNFLLSTSTGTNLLNIDEGLSKIYAFNKELAFKEDINGGTASEGTVVMFRRWS